MITNKEQISMIKGLISELSESQQLTINDLIYFLREKASKNTVETTIAISLILCEINQMGTCPQ